MDYAEIIRQALDRARADAAQSAWLFDRDGQPRLARIVREEAAQYATIAALLDAGRLIITETPERPAPDLDPEAFAVALDAMRGHTA